MNWLPKVRRNIVCSPKANQNVIIPQKCTTSQIVRQKFTISKVAHQKFTKGSALLEESLKLAPKMMKQQKTSMCFVLETGIMDKHMILLPKFIKM